MIIIILLIIIITLLKTFFIQGRDILDIVMHAACSFHASFFQHAHVDVCDVLVNSFILKFIFTNMLIKKFVNIFLIKKPRLERRLFVITYFCNHPISQKLLPQLALDKAMFFNWKLNFIGKVWLCKMSRCSFYEHHISNHGASRHQTRERQEWSLFRLKLW